MSDPNHASALVPAVVFLSAAVCAVLLSKRLKLGAVIGYLLAGVVIGPQVLKLITDEQTVLAFSELGVVFLLFVLGRYLIGLYIAQAAPGSAYGSMGALVILLVWMYYAAVVFFVGAWLTAVIDERARARATLSAANIPLPVQNAATAPAEPPTRK